MNTSALTLATLLTILVVPPVAGQTGVRAPQGWSLGVLGGAAAFSDMQRGSVRLIRPTPAGIEQFEMARRVGAETSTTLAAYLAYWPAQSWGLRLHGTWAPTRFETLMKESDAQAAGLPRSSSEDGKLAGLTIMTGDLQLLFRVPAIKNRVMPYGIVGGGVTRYEVKSGEEPVPEEAEGQFEDGAKLRPSGVFGIGAMLPLSNRAFRLHFELTTQLTNTPLPGGERQSEETPDGMIEYDPAGQPPGESRVRLTSSVRFMIGLSVAARR